MKYKEITVKIKQAPYLDFGEVFNDAFALYQKVWLQGLLMIILSFLSFMGLYMILIVPMMASSFFIDGQINSGESVGSILLMVCMFLIYIFIIAGAIIANLGLQAAFYRIVRVKDRNSDQMPGVNFGMFFKKEYVKKLAVFSLAYLGIMILSYILCVLPILYVCIPLQFSLIIFAFHPEWSLSDIFTVGFRLGNKKWGISFALALVCGILAYIVGFLACVVGIYATMSFIILPGYLIYKKVVGFTEVEDAIAQIGSE